jgi:hypothetical protein
MPFTFSHPAIVLPLKINPKSALSLTGLVAGSVTPDFEYFIRMKGESIYSHTFGGIFWFDLPLGLLLTFIYHNIVRNAFITNLPPILNNRLNNFKSFNWIEYFKRNWFMVLVSIVIGAASHLFWDSFTHPTGYFVERSKLLQSSTTIFKGRVHLFTILQHLSSLIGGVIVLWAIFSLKSKPSAQSDKKARYWLSVSVITLIILVIRFFAGLNFHLYTDILITLISAFLISLIITPLAYKLILNKNAV